MWMCEHFRVSDDEGQAKTAGRTVTGGLLLSQSQALLPLVKVRSGNNCVL